jgi:hypothetical protein
MEDSKCFDFAATQLDDLVAVFCFSAVSVVHGSSWFDVEMDGRSETGWPLASLSLAPKSVSYFRLRRST